MLSLYRRAIARRKDLIADLSTTDPALTFLTAPPEVLHFRRGDHWHCVTNFGHEPIGLPEGTVALSSVGLVQGELPGDATAWVVSAG